MHCERVIPTVFARTKREFDERLARLLPLADVLQVDFMDGKLVPATGVAMADVPDLRSSGKEFEAHLMVAEPRVYIPVLKQKGFARVIVHVEAHRDGADLRQTLALAHACGLEAMLALNPQTPLARAEEFAGSVAGVLLMGIPPGKEGQTFDPQVEERVRALRKRFPRLHVQVDGGITPPVARRLAAAGFCAVNTGSFVARSHDPKLAMLELQRAFAPPLEPRRASAAELARVANALRKDIVRMLAHAGSGHSAGPLGMAEVFACIYFHEARYDATQPQHPDRDFVFLSNGHICPVWYAALARAGFFPAEELASLRRLGSRLQGHPHTLSLPGVENSGGPLAQGLSQAAGCALALRQGHRPNRVYCVASDGEHDEGQAWEAAIFAAHQRLDNLVVVIDRNDIQIDGPTHKVLGLEPLAAKYRAFNWHVFEVDGNDCAAIVQALARARAAKGRPSVIIARTVPGKGVSFMEGKYEWHGRAPNPDEARRALEELDRS